MGSDKLGRALAAQPQKGTLAVMRDAKRMIAARGIEVDLKGLKAWDDPKVGK
jgi:hypothetical protein